MPNEVGNELLEVLSDVVDQNNATSSALFDSERNPVQLALPIDEVPITDDVLDIRRGHMKGSVECSEERGLHLVLLPNSYCLYHLMKMSTYMSSYGIFGGS
ncbi:hypothetical protein PanWU01x14_252900 [Parasponia andersonii]|uniref:Uncharacterized protein n=1 Tax=Parasponia andersonii TaxID=3476 RepID=A0A2P5BBX9_PARAD|nr:hypothetical protein PanWU01x14_252900 [Parasponia andersonii]